jgi:NADPH-dependent ferric siderophore reductase
VKSRLPDLLPDETGPYVWIACGTATTRTIVAYARKEPKLPRQRVHALGRWRAA